MSFGISNVGVINQQNAPAIWESEFADFPTNYVLGRILIATDGIGTEEQGIYIDGTSSRTQITNGLISAINGLTENTSEIKLGGTLAEDTTIEVQSYKLQFGGNVYGTEVTTDGYIRDTGSSLAYSIIGPNGTTPVIPNTSIIFLDPRDGTTYLVAVQQL